MCSFLCCPRFSSHLETRCRLVFLGRRNRAYNSLQWCVCVKFGSIEEDVTHANSGHAKSVAKSTIVACVWRLWRSGRLSKRERAESSPVYRSHRFHMAPGGLDKTRRGPWRSNLGMIGFIRMQPRRMVRESDQLEDEPKT